jgi:hypothetical protein
MKTILRVLILVVSIPFGKVFGGLVIEVYHTPEVLTFEIIRNVCIIVPIWVAVLAALIWLYKRVPPGMFAGDAKCSHCSYLVNRWRPHRCSFDGQRRLP